MTVQDGVIKHISKNTMKIDNKIVILSQSLKSVNINLIYLEWRCLKKIIKIQFRKNKNINL